MRAPRHAGSLGRRLTLRRSKEQRRDVYLENAALRSSFCAKIGTLRGHGAPHADGHSKRVQSCQFSSR